MSKTSEEKKAYVKAWRATHAQHSRAYRQANAERIKARQQAYNEKNAARVKAHKQAYRQEHLDEARAYDKAYSLAHKAQKHAYYAATKLTRTIRAQRYYAANKDQINAAAKQWQQRNRTKRLVIEQRYIARHPDIIKAKKHTDSARRRGAPIRDLTRQQWLDIQTSQDHRCAYCGKRAKGHLTQDHITPISAGGSHTLHNVIAACRNCNSRKGNRAVLRAVQPLLL